MELEEARARNVAGVILGLLADVEQHELRVLELRREPVARDEKVAACELVVLRRSARGDGAGECDGESAHLARACGVSSTCRRSSWLVIGGGGGQSLTATWP